MKQFLSIIGILCTVLTVHAQGTDYYVPKLKDITVAELPEEVVYKGEFLTCTAWTDKLGENYLVTSQSPVHEEELPEGTPMSSKELYARHYLKKEKDFSLLWQLYDFLKDGYCGQFTVDYLCKPYINDLDHDGVCETWLVYQLGCRSDWGTPPQTMKIIMHSGAKKCAIRGERDVLYPQPCYVPSGVGSFREDDNYKALPAAVRDFGIVLWHKFQVEELEVVN